MEITLKCKYAYMIIAVDLTLYSPYQNGQVSDRNASNAVNFDQSNALNLHLSNAKTGELRITLNYWKKECIKNALGLII